LNCVETINITKRYPVLKNYSDVLLRPFKKKEITALQNVSIQIKSGELFALIGPNGAGKTTLIKILCTLVLPTSGKAFVSGFDVAKHGNRIRQKIGYVVSDERSFYWRLTGRQNLIFFATLNNLSGKSADERIGRLLEFMDMSRDADRKFKSYSTGMKQKLAIARGLLTDPEIIFMDEPTRSLDPVTAHNLRKLIKEKLIDLEKKTVIYATHNLKEVEDLSDRMAIIDQGEIKYLGTVTGLKKDFRSHETYVIELLNAEKGLKARLNTIPSIKGILECSAITPTQQIRIEAEIEKNENISHIIETIIKMGGNISSFYRKEPSLDEVFSNLLRAGKKRETR
jgi:ABC-2 type transport system ATP-binding protein